MPDIIDVLQDLKCWSHHLDNFSKKITELSPEENFRNIRKLIESLDQPITSLPPSRSEYYRNQWSRFTRGEITSLSRGALKYLCWDSDLLEETKFCDYVMQTVPVAPARVIKGLVRSIHLKWTKDLPDSEIVKYTAKQVISFSGRDRTLAKWKLSTDMILGSGGAALFAKNVLLNPHEEPKDGADKWALSENSAYMRYAVVNAADQCLPSLGRNKNITDYILETLLTWNGWESNRKGFDFIVDKLILHDNVDFFAERLRTALLGHKLLGDPRLPANRNKWSGVDVKAKQRFIGWLSRLDIVFFFDHVLKGKDRHGRREFWLKYVDRMVASRPLLSDSTSILLKNKRDVNYGKLSSSANQAAFLLDFGDLIVVEFSNVGMIYIYKRAEFVKRLQDFWTNSIISEGLLKNQRLPDERKIRHQALDRIVYVDWRDNAASILAREGVRP